MARSKKIAKNAVKRGSKRSKQQKQTRPVMAAKQTEKDFLQIPAKLLANLDKQVTSLQKQESKLDATAKKLSAQIQKAKTRMDTFKSKASPAAKKQFNANKKIYQYAVKAYAQTTKQLKQITKLYQASKQKQAKLQALHKYLKDFEKMWAKNAKKPQALKKSKKRTVKNNEAKYLQATNNRDLPQFTSHETNEHLHFDETLEPTS